MKNHLKPRDLACYENLSKTHLKKKGQSFFVLKKRTIIFSQNPRFQFLNPILDGLCVSFKTRHFFMWKQFMCVDCYTGKFTLSNIILHKSNRMNIGCQSSWNEEGQMHAMNCSISKEFNSYKLLKRNTLSYPWFWSPNKTF